MPVIVCDEAIFSRFVHIDPLYERIPQIVHLLRDEQRCLFIDPFIFIHDADLSVIERCIKNFERICPLCSIGGMQLHSIGSKNGIARRIDLPLTAGRCILYEICRPAIFKDILDESLNIFRRNPCCAQIDFDLIGG